MGRSMKNRDAAGYYILQRRNYIGKYRLVPASQGILAQMSRKLWFNGVVFGRYELEPSNYPWSARLWKAYMKSGDVPPLNHSRFQCAINETTRHIVSLVAEESIVLVDDRKNRRELKLPVPDRCDTPNELERFFRTVIKNTVDAVNRVGRDDLRVENRPAAMMYNIIRCIIIYDDASYDIREVSPNRFADMCGVTMTNTGIKPVSMRK